MKNLFYLLIIAAVGFGIYKVLDETQVIQKAQCLVVGKTPVSSNDIGAKTDNPKTICAEPTTDANKECYDSLDCKEACIVERYSEGYEHAGDFVLKNGADKRGYCQPYEDMDCFIERKSGMIVIHKCSQE
jgi:hypothetical protein